MAVAEHPEGHAIERRLCHVRDPYIEGHRGNGAVELRRGLADDGELMLVDADGLAHDGWVRGEVRAPIPVTEDGNRRFAGSVGNFHRLKEAAHFGLNAKDG